MTKDPFWLIQTTDPDHLTTAGQSYFPYQDNIYAKTLPFTPPPKPIPEIPPLELNAMALENGWVIQQEKQHFIPGVTVRMLDWWWSNMEKGYYLWAPGSHKRFNWVREPWRYGFVNSAHCIAESVGEGYAVFGGNGIQINRLDMDYFPFTEALEHVIVEGVFNDLGEFIDMTVHMWDACVGGCRHITAAVANPYASEPPRFVIEMMKAGGKPPIAPSSTDHCEYEAGRWSLFLPQLYQLWDSHPDPTQNVFYDLSVRKNAQGQWEYVHENGPIVFPKQ